VKGNGWQVLAGAATVLATFLATSLLVVPPAVAQSTDEWKCTARTELPLDQRISSCTSLIDSGKYGLSGAMRAYFHRARAYLAKDDTDSAIADYTELIKLSPNNQFAYACRGFAYNKQGDFDHAIADYTQVIEFNPRDAHAYAGRAHAYKAKGDFNRAVADYDQVIQLAPKAAKIFRARGITNLQAGSLPKSLEDLKQSSALDPKDSYTSLWLDIVATCRAASPRQRHNST